jgi:hypothetical protein
MRPTVTPAPALLLGVKPSVPTSVLRAAVDTMGASFFDGFFAVAAGMISGSLEIVSIASRFEYSASLSASSSRLIALMNGCSASIVWPWPVSCCRSHCS